MRKTPPRTISHWTTTGLCQRRHLRSPRESFSLLTVAPEHFSTLDSDVDHIQGLHHVSHALGSCEIACRRRRRAIGSIQGQSKLGLVSHRTALSSDGLPSWRKSSKFACYSPACAGCCRQASVIALRGRLEPGRHVHGGCGSQRDSGLVTERRRRYLVSGRYYRTAVSVHHLSPSASHGQLYASLCSRALPDLHAP